MKEFYSSRRVVVTGGAGLIGSFVCDELIAHGARVTVIDDFSKGRREHLAQTEGNVTIIEGNLEHPDVAMESFAGAEIVFHLASRAYGIGYGESHHLETLRHNEAITNSVLAASERHGIERFIAVSSSCVYDDNGPDMMSELPLFDGNPEYGNRGYGWAKRFLESKVSLYAQETGMAATIVRPFNIYGERYQWVGEYSQAIPMLTKRIMDGENPVVIWGSGNQQRSYVHAHDCARMMIALVESGHHGEPVNIGTQETITIKDLAILLSNLAGVTPAIKFDTSKPEGRFIKSADMSRFYSIVPDFSFSLSLREGLERMPGWYRQAFGTASPEMSPNQQTGR